jgi:D-lactate dehydrogenase (cytochrome)
MLAEELVREAGATDVTVARTALEQAAQWEARHHVYWALVNSHPGHTYTITDTAVPLAHLPEIIAHAQQLLETMGLEGSIVGHVGDGNFHTLVATKPHDNERAKAFSEQIVRRALAVGGTASGEHGIGLAKRAYMDEEHGAALPWMRRIKALFDPEGLLNPGKIV